MNKLAILLLSLGLLAAARAVVLLTTHDATVSTVRHSAQAHPDAELQALFALPKAGGPNGTSRLWLGADCGTSLALPNNRTLWLFGDTLLGTWSNGQRNLDGCAMPHQTAAFQDGTGPLAFAWRESEASGMPTNLFWPVGSRDAAVLCGAPFSESTPYYWVVA